MTPKQELLSDPAIRPDIAKWYDANIPDDATNEVVGEYATKALKRFTTCDCDPPKAARIVEGAELAEWEPELNRVLGDKAPVPDGYRLEYIMMCPDYPNACVWIEGTYVEKEAATV